VGATNLKTGSASNREGKLDGVNLTLCEFKQVYDYYTPTQINFNKPLRNVHLIETRNMLCLFHLFRLIAQIFTNNYLLC